MNRYWMEDSFGKYGVELVPFGPYQMPLKRYQYHIRQLPERDGGLPDRPDAEPDAVQPELLHRRARRLDAADVGATQSARRSTTCSGPPPARTSRLLAGVRRDALHRQDTVTDAFGPKAYRPAAPARQLGDDPLHPVDLVGRGRERLAERQRQQLDRGRERRHGRLRARALAQPRHPGQLQQPVPAPSAADRRRHVGHDEPRLVQRPGRPAHPLADPADAGLARSARSTTCATSAS